MIKTIQPLQQKKKSPQEAYESDRAMALSVKDYPRELIKPSWEEFKFLMHKALPSNSKKRVNAHPLTWRNFIKFERDFKMPEMELALDILEIATPLEMNQTLDENQDMLWDIVYKMRMDWQKIDGELSEPIKAKINAQVKASQSVPIGHKIFREDGQPAN